MAIDSTQCLASLSARSRPLCFAGLITALLTCCSVTLAGPVYDLKFVAKIERASLPSGEALSGKLSVGQTITGTFIVDPATTITNLDGKRTALSISTDNYFHMDLPKKLSLDGPLKVSYEGGFIRIGPDGSKLWTMVRDICETYSKMPCKAMGQIETTHTETGVKKAYDARSFVLQQPAANQSGDERNFNVPLVQRLNEIVDLVEQGDTQMILSFDNDPNSYSNNASSRERGAFLRLRIESMQIQEQ